MSETMTPVVDSSPPQGVSTPAPVKRTIRSLEDELFAFDDNLSVTTDERAVLAAKLSSMASRVQLDDVDLKDPKAVQAATTVIGAALKALDAIEGSASRRVNVKLKQAENTRNDATSEQVVDLYRRMAGGTLIDTALPAIDLSSISTDLTADYISAGNLILDTELRVDPDDLS